MEDQLLEREANERTRQSSQSGSEEAKGHRISTTFVSQIYNFDNPPTSPIKIILILNKNKFYTSIFINLFIQYQIHFEQVCACSENVEKMYVGLGLGWGHMYKEKTTSC